MPRLDVMENGKRRSVDFAETIVIGRDRENGVTINDPMSSRRHCQLTREGGRYYLEDLKSSNGTLLNGRRAAKIEVTDGDKIEVGQVAIVFCEQAAAPAKPAPQAAPAEPAPDPAAASSDAILEEDDTADDSATNGATPFLEFGNGARVGQRVALDTVPFAIGRRQDNQLPLEDKRVSGKHASIIKEGAQWVIVDHDSGNGVVINGKRVQRAPLRDGLVLALGETELRCVGFGGTATAAPTPGAQAQATAPQRAAASVSDDGFGAEEVRRIRVEAAPQGGGPLQAIGTVLFLVAFLAILYFGYDLVSRRLAGRRVEADPDNLITANPSFEMVSESGALSGWQLCPDGDSARLDVAEGLKEVDDGMRAGRLVATGTERGFVRLRNEALINVQPEQKLTLFGMVQNDGFEMAALEVLWMRRGSEGDEVVAESVTRGISTGPGYRPLSATVMAPQGLGVEYCCAAVIGWGGSGSLLVDRVALSQAAESEAVAAPIALEVEENRRKVRALCGGVSGLTVIEGRSRTLIASARVAAIGHGFPFGEILGRVVEPLQEGDGGIHRASVEFPVDGYRSRVQLESTSERREGSLHFGWQIRKAPGAAEQLALIIELSDYAAKLPMGAHGEGAHLAARPLAELDKKSVTEWQMGSRDQQLSMIFSSPVELRVAPPQQRRSGTSTVLVMLPTEARESRFSMSLHLGSPREQQEITNELAAVDALVAQGRGGDALREAAALVERFPWRDDLRAIVDKRRAAIRRGGQQELAVLQEMRAELLEFSGSPIQDLLRERAEALADSFGGTSVGNDAGELLQWIESELGSAEAARASGAAKDLMAKADARFRAERYFHARFYYQQVVERFPGTDEARTAKQQLKTIVTRTRVRKGR